VYGAYRKLCVRSEAEVKTELTSSRLDCFLRVSATDGEPEILDMDVDDVCLGSGAGEGARS
jgi:hypothetical protein